MHLFILAMLSLLSIIEGSDWSNKSLESKKRMANYALPLFLKRSEILKKYGLDEKTDIGKFSKDIDTCYKVFEEEEWFEERPTFVLKNFKTTEYKTNAEIIAKFIIYKENDLWSFKINDDLRTRNARYVKLYDLLAILAAQEVFEAVRLRYKAEKELHHNVLQTLKNNHVTDFEEYEKGKQRQFEEIYLSAQYAALDIHEKCGEYKEKWDKINHFDGYTHVIGMKIRLEECINHNNFSFDLNKIDTDKGVQEIFSKIADISLETGRQAAGQQNSVKVPQKSEQKYKIYEHEDALEKVVKLYEYLSALAADQHHRRIPGTREPIWTFKSTYEKLYYYKYEYKRLDTKLKEYKKRGKELTLYGIEKNMNVEKLKEAIDKCFQGTYLHPGFRFDLKNIAEDRRLQIVIARVAEVACEYEDAKRIYAGLYELLAILAAHQGNLAKFREIYIKMKDTDTTLQLKTLKGGKSFIVETSEDILDEEANEMLAEVLAQKHVLERYGIDAERDADLFKDYNFFHEKNPHASEIIVAMTRETKVKRSDLCKVSLILAGQHISMAVHKFEEIDIKLGQIESKIKKSLIEKLSTKISEPSTRRKEEKILEYQQKKENLTFYSINSMADAETIKDYFSDPTRSRAGSEMIPDMRLIYKLMLTMAAQDVAAARNNFIKIFREYKVLTTISNQRLRF